MLDLTKMIKKSDIITPKMLKPISKKSPKMTGEIMKGVTDVVSLIKSIEKYSDDNGLTFGKRIPYAIYTENAMINVAQAYFINEKTLCVVGFSPIGLGTQVYENGKVKSSTQDISTYVIPTDHIHCVSFGSYDPDKIEINPVSEEGKAKISEQELMVSLSKLKEDLNSLNSTGWDRAFIIKANIGMAQNYMADKTQLQLFNNHKIIQLSQDVARLYHDKLENILAYFLKDEKENFMFNYKDDIQLTRKYRFFKSEEDRLNYLKNSDPRNYSNNNNTFTFDEVREFTAFFENEKLSEEIEEKMKLPETTKFEVKFDGIDEALLSMEYYKNYEDNPGIPVFQIIRAIPEEKKLKASDEEYYYFFIGISTTANSTVAMGSDEKIYDSATVYPVFQAVPIKKEEPEEEEKEEEKDPEPDPEPPVTPPPTEPDEPDEGGEEEGGDDPDPTDPDNPNNNGDDGDEDEDDEEEEPEPEPEPEPDPEEEDEEDEPEPEDEDPEETSDDENEDDQDTDDTEESDKNVDEE